MKFYQIVYILLSLSVASRAIDSGEVRRQLSDFALSFDFCPLANSSLIPFYASFSFRCKEEICVEDYRRARNLPKVSVQKSLW